MERPMLADVGSSSEPELTASGAVEACIVSLFAGLVVAAALLRRPCFLAGRHDDLVSSFCVLWGQMRFLRFVTLIATKEMTVMSFLGDYGWAAYANLLALFIAMAMPSPPALALLMVATLSLGWRSLPFEVDNSGTFGLLLDLNLLPGLLMCLSEGGAGQSWLATLPAARAMLVVQYIFATLAKLNWDFADTRRSAISSCMLMLSSGNGIASTFAEHNDKRLLLFFQLIVKSVNMWEVLIAATMVWAPIPWGIYTAWGFHIAIFFAYDYGVLCCASYFFFQPDSLLVMRWGLTVPGRLSVLIIAAMCIYAANKSNRDFIMLISTIWMLCLCPALWLDDDSLECDGDGHVSLVAWGVCMICLMVCNGLGPYLGFKTGSTWTMFSNLRSHSEPNHMFLRCKPYCSWSSDVVTVTYSTAESVRDYHAELDLRDPPEIVAGALQLSQEANDLKNAAAAFARRNLDNGGCIIYSNSPLGIKRKATIRAPPYRLPFWQLRSLVAQEMLCKATFSLRYDRGQSQFSVEVENGELISGDAAATNAPPLILRKIIWFRSLPMTDEGGGINSVP